MRELKAIKIWTKDEILEDYKQRIDKAIEYIENECLDDNYNYCFDLCGDNIFKVLNILKGESNEGI